MKNKLILLAFVVFVIYSISVIVNQQIKLNSYAKQKEYYQEEYNLAKEKAKELELLKENVNSPEYIEEIARKKLDMYYPNEKVYVDINR